MVISIIVTVNLNHTAGVLLLCHDYIWAKTI